MGCSASSYHFQHESGLSVVVATYAQEKYPTLTCDDSIDLNSENQCCKVLDVDAEGTDASESIRGSPVVIRNANLNTSDSSLHQDDSFSLDDFISQALKDTSILYSDSKIKLQPSPLVHNSSRKSRISMATPSTITTDNSNIISPLRRSSAVSMPPSPPPIAAEFNKLKRYQIFTTHGNPLLPHDALRKTGDSTHSDILEETTNCRRDILSNTAETDALSRISSARNVVTSPLVPERVDFSLEYHNVNNSIYGKCPESMMGYLEWRESNGILWKKCFAVVECGKLNLFEKKMEPPIYPPFGVNLMVTAPLGHYTVSISDSRRLYLTNKTIDIALRTPDGGTNRFSALDWADGLSAHIRYSQTLVLASAT